MFVPAPQSKGPRNSACSNKIWFIIHIPVYSLFDSNVDFKSACFFFFALRLCCCDANFKILHDYCAASLQANATLYLKPLNKDGNLQVCTYCMHAQKVPETPTTHFRDCNILKFPGGMPPDPPHTICIMPPPLLYLTWDPPILSGVQVLTCTWEDVVYHYSCFYHNSNIFTFQKQDLKANEVPKLHIQYRYKELFVLSHVHLII